MTINGLAFLKKIALNYTDQIIPFGFKKSIFSIFQEKGSFWIKSENFKTNLRPPTSSFSFEPNKYFNSNKYLKLDLNKIKEKIKYISPSDGRGNQFKLRMDDNKTITIINDAYNSSPHSLETSLTNLYKNNSINTF